MFIFYKITEIVSVVFFTFINPTQISPISCPDLPSELITDLIMIECYRKLRFAKIYIFLCEHVFSRLVLLFFLIKCVFLPP